MELSPLEFALVFSLIAVMALAVGWIIVRGAKRNYRGERAELRIAAGELATLVPKEFQLEPCVSCGGTKMDLTAVGDAGATVAFRCAECGSEGSVTGDASAKLAESWDTFRKRRDAFQKRHSSDTDAVLVQFRVRSSKR